MASPNVNWSEITTATLFNRSKTLADNMSKNNALLARLNEKGNVKPADGGEALVQELDYAENGTFKRYTGYDVLNIATSDVFSAAQYPWAQAAVASSRRFNRFCLSLSLNALRASSAFFALSAGVIFVWR